MLRFVFDVIEILSMNDIGNDDDKFGEFIINDGYYYYLFVTLMAV